MDTTRRSKARTRGAGAALPPELDYPFRLIAFDWTGTAVASRSADATRVVGLIDQLLHRGTRIAIVTGTDFQSVSRQLGSSIATEHARRLFVCTNRGAEVYGFNRRGAPVAFWRSHATPEEERCLDMIADGVKGQLERLTGLPIALIRARLNRRKIDLIPEPAFHEPPKSAIGELLAATEARLRGAGLRRGLRDAFELTHLLAQETGLPDAKVTSDVKHIEVGLTDKADAMRYLFRRVAEPLQIAAGNVLIVGDEFGAIAGLEGSDHKMLKVPELEGAAAASVGLEPEGTPPSVLHLGGGPDRFCEVLEHQLAVEGRGHVFAVPRDAAWIVEKLGLDLSREQENEALLTIANGYVGSRGSIAEGTTGSRLGTFLAGAFEPSADIAAVPELVTLPEWGRMRFVIDGNPFSVETNEVLHHRRILDMHRGVLLREALARGPGDRLTLLRTIHLASMADQHLLIEGVQICPLNYSGTVRVDAVLSGEVRSESGAEHWQSFEAASGEAGPLLVGRTRRGLVAALASHLEVGRPMDGDTQCRRETGETWASECCELPVQLGEPREVYRATALYSSREEPEPRGAAERRRLVVSAESLSRLIAHHEARWTERWRKADVSIDGAPKIERALRFALYHLISAVNPDDPRCSIGARSLSGGAYRGHVFWDTEIFMLPLFIHCYPEAARALLTYRHRTLEGARRKAEALGYHGALYPWESADTGDETTPSEVRSQSGEVVRILSGELEHHISADVAYTVWLYGRCTGDREFVRGPGLEILIETARFWASRVVLGADGLFHIRRVIGPDEYHEEVDDNAFTNWMARFNLSCAAEAVEAARSPQIGVSKDEMRSWRAIADAMYLGLDQHTGLIEQFAGFHGLEAIDLAALGACPAPADVILGRERTQRSQVVKQADVVHLVALLWDDLAPEVRKRCFVHYEPRTSHGSSLSLGVHALVAARLGQLDKAERYLEQTADIDLGNSMGNSAGGVHAAALGSLWQAVVHGVGGVRPAPDDAEALVLEPHLPPGWRHLGFPLVWRGRELRIDIEPQAIDVLVEEGAPLSIRTIAPSGATSAVRAEPGRRHVVPVQISA